MSKTFPSLEVSRYPAIAVHARRVGNYTQVGCSIGIEVFSMIIDQIRGLPAGLVIPKPEATAHFRIQGWATRRGEPALIYSIPNHKNPDKPFRKGIAVSEFLVAYAEIKSSGHITRKWFNASLARCAQEGACNFTTIGGVFELLGIARYSERGKYVAC